MSNVELLPLPLPMHMLQAFLSALKGQRGEMDAWLEVNNEADVRLHVEAYVEASTEELRAEVAKQSAYAKRTHDWNTDLLANNERLAEALREIERKMPKDRAGPSWIARTIAAEALHPTAAQENDHA